jgi:hypothetical protein
MNNMTRSASRLLLGGALLSLAALLTAPLARADSDDGYGAFSVAVIGDWPYANTATTPPKRVLFDNAHLLSNSVNADRSVTHVMHVGDIHSGSEPCTGSGLSPVPAGSQPTYNLAVFGFFQNFNAPLIYTPGDNEWTDCHKKKQFSSGAPLNELAAVRGLFFSNPGVTLGARKIRVSTQAHDYNRNHPQDAQFVENVMWQHRNVMFVTVNMPGSNNDGLVWTAPFTDEPARVAEAAKRTLADLRWLNKAFDRAEEQGAKGLVIGLQADMFDPAAVAAGGDGLGNYTIFVQELAERALRFGRPVLLINGDSHLFGSDKPLADPSSPTGRIHNTPAVPNLTRITVQGSTSGPAEWLRLSINPDSTAVFSFKNIPYCNAPLSACP